MFYQQCQIVVPGGLKFHSLFENHVMVASAGVVNSGVCTLQISSFHGPGELECPMKDCYVLCVIVIKNVGLLEFGTIW